jgi:hypothetical protein
MRSKPISQKLATVQFMPRLRHYPDKSVPFKPSDSEVLRWFSTNPGAIEWLFGQCRRLLRYDAATGTWRGRETP